MSSLSRISTVYECWCYEVPNLLFSLGLTLFDLSGVTVQSWCNASGPQVWCMPHIPCFLISSWFVRVQFLCPNSAEHPVSQVCESAHPLPACSRAALGMGVFVQRGWSPTRQQESSSRESRLCNRVTCVLCFTYCCPSAELSICLVAARCCTWIQIPNSASAGRRHSCAHWRNSSLSSDRTNDCGVRWIEIEAGQIESTFDFRGIQKGANETGMPPIRPITVCKCSCLFHLHSFVMLRGLRTEFVPHLLRIVTDRMLSASRPARALGV